MRLAELELLLAHFSAEKEAIEGGYYRIRATGEAQYELAFLMPDSCGTTSVNPQITVSVEGERVRPIALIDVYRMPIRKLTYTEETAEELELALADLVTTFKKVKGLD